MSITEDFIFHHQLKEATIFTSKAG